MDGEKFSRIHAESVPPGRDIGIYEQTMRFPGTNVRFLRIIAKNHGLIPPGANGAGQPAWLFVDEVSVD